MSASPGSWSPGPWPPLPGPPTPTRPRTADRAGTIVMLVLAWLTMLLGGVMMLVLLAYLGSCLPSRCSGGAQAVSVAALVAGVVAVLATTVLAIVRMARRRRSWPAGIAALGGVVVALLVSAVAYLEAATGLS